MVRQAVRVLLLVRRVRGEGVAVGEATVEVGLGRFEGEQRADGHAVADRAILAR